MYYIERYTSDSVITLCVMELGHRHLRIVTSVPAVQALRSEHPQTVFR